MHNSVLNIPEEEYNQILNIVAKELAERNNTSLELEIRELKAVDRYNLDINMTASLAFSFINNLQFDEDERLLQNDEAQNGVNFILDVSNYFNGDDEDKKYFVNEWIRVFAVTRVSYSVEIMRKIKELRLEKGLSQKQVANLLNISSQAYGHYENGKREPDLNTIIKLSRIFKVSIDYLVELYSPQYLSENFLLKDTPHIAKQKLTQPVADFIIKLKSFDIDDKKFSELSDEQIKIIVSIIKQNI